MIEKAVAMDILENIENDLKCGNTDNAIENINKILNNKLYYLMLEYKKNQEKYGKNNRKTLRIEQKIDKEMNNILFEKN